MLWISKDDGFHRLLFASNFRFESSTAVEYTLAFAVENQARILLLHVINGPQREWGNACARSVAETMHKLDEIVPRNAELW